MKTTKRRLVTLAVIGSIGALVLSSGAANAVGKSKTKLAKAVVYSFTDPAGDANGINSQGDIAPQDPEMSTPVNQASADIILVTFKRLDDGKVIQGFTVTMTLTGTPDQTTFYRVTSSTDACSTFWFQYSAQVGTTAGGTLRHNCFPVPNPSPTSVVLADTNIVSIPTVVTAHSITWTLLVKDFPKGVKIGKFLSAIRAETRGNAGAAGKGLTAPVIDQTKVQTIDYKIGS